MRIMLGGAVLRPGWRGGEPHVIQGLEQGLRARGIEVEVARVERSGVGLASMALTPLDLDVVAVGRYRAILQRARPDAVIGFYDFDSSLCVAANELDVPYVSAVHIHWPLCPIGTLYLEGIGPCPGPSAGRCVRHMGSSTIVTHLAEYEGSLPAPLATMVYAKFRTRHRLLSRSSAIVVPSRWMEAVLSRGGYRGIRVVPNGMRADEFPFRPWVPGPKRVAYISGSTTERKGWPDFHEVARRLAPRRKDAEFVATGFGGDAVVTGVPRLSGAEFVEEVSRAYVVVVPALWEEPFGLVALEAMAAGRPVVAYASGALPEIVEEGRTGYLVPRGDVGALTSAVERVLDDPRRAAELGQNGRRRVEEVFPLARMVDGYLSVVKGLLR